MTESELNAIEAKADDTEEDHDLRADSRALVAEVRRLRGLAKEFIDASNEVVLDSDRCSRDDRRRWAQTQWKLEEALP